MSAKRYALVVENEVFDIINVPESSARAKEMHDGFTNSPVGMNVTNFKNISFGSKWNGKNFINTTTDDQINNTYPQDSEIYAFLSNDEVFFLIFIPNGKTLSAMYKAAFNANPTAIYISDDLVDVELGDIWNGKTFTKAGSK